MMTKLVGAALGAGLIALSASATAETIQVRWQTETESASWRQDTNPTPVSYNPGSSTTVSVSDADPSFITSIQFFSSSQGGGFTDEFNVFTVSGEQVYSGSEDHPVFSAGSYSLYDSSISEVGTLTFLLTAAPPVPEAPTWVMMMLGGFAGLSALAIAKHRRAPTA
jgi:hypothetical protein